MQPLAHTWVVAVIALALIGFALTGWARRRDALDLRYALATAPWVALVVLDHLATTGHLQGYERVATRAAYQLLVLGVSAFLLSAVDHFRGQRVGLGLAVVQAVVGLALAAVPASVLWAPAWIGWNALLSTALALLLAHATWSRAGAKGWMVLLMAIFGLGVMLADMRAAGAGPVTVAVTHYFYVVGLFVLWLALTRRVDAQVDTIIPGAQARQRLAQDLHDGVGSQLASIISALGTGTPQQRATAASLHQCLAELKLLVDGADNDASALSLLASLRYRMQPLLEATGVTLHWELADTEVLDAIEGDAALQILRIAQEALANAVRHSGATEVAVMCCHVKMRQALLLEVVDNGIGLPPGLWATDGAVAPSAGVRLGKGLLGMQRRAHQLGGKMSIDAARHQGTRVRLLVPLARLLQTPHSERAHLA